MEIVVDKRIVNRHALALRLYFSLGCQHMYTLSLSLTFPFNFFFRSLH